MKNVIGLVRAKNEARWIGRTIRSMNTICQNVIVMDDHSTDATVSFAAAVGAVIQYSPFPDGSFQETRDKNWLQQRALEIFPDTAWFLMLDGDEALSPAGQEAITQDLLNETPFQSFRFPIRYLWDRFDQVRIDRWYSVFTRASMWRVATGQHFISTYDTGLHCGNTPSGLSCIELPAPILHYGYMLREDRIRKFRYYNRLDPHNPFEDGYKHMVLGDLPEYPASMVTKWAGPLELAPL